MADEKNRRVGSDPKAGFPEPLPKARKGLWISGLILLARREIQLR